MKNALTIARKELKVYFVSPVFFIVTALFVLASGFFFAVNTLQSQTVSISTTFSIILFVMILLAPLLTMRLIAQEKGEGTLELLFSHPIRDVELVAGKFAAAMVIYLALLATTLIQVLVPLFTAVDKHQFLFLSLGTVDWATLGVGYLGNFLIIGSYLAIGLFASSLTRNQIIAAVIAFVVLLMLLVIDGAGALAQPPLSDFLSQLGPRAHADNFARGTLGLFDVVYALSMIVVPLYLAVVALGARRWH
ncbi:MAG: ABC transporter permease [Candidatus Dormibacteraeota bacterium]|nr:ABC transporter permease [Candidatus Dormibacteraeota bacterium]